MDSKEENSADMSIAKRRGRREKVDKKGKGSALERLKMARETGCKFLEEKEEMNVYEEVDEAEYSRIVHDRQQDDWIVDDGTGYVEDGREIFDDDLYDQQAASKKKTKTKKPTQNSNIKPPKPANNSIKNLFAAVSNSNKAKKVQKASNKLEGDELLDNLMDELGGDDDDEDDDDDDVVLPTPVVVKRMKKKDDDGAWKKAKMYDNDDDGGGGGLFLSNNNNKIDNKKNNTNNKNNSNINNKNNEMNSINKIFNEKTEKSEDIKIEKSTKIKTTNNRTENNNNNENNNINNNNNNNINNNEEEMTLDTTDVGFDDDDDDDDLINCSTIDQLPKIEDDEEEDAIDMKDCTDGTKAEEDDDGGDNDDEGMKVYWLDAYEDYFKQPGTIYLFGKTWNEEAKKYVSCCVIVKDVPRKVYLLPRCKRLVKGEEEGDDLTFADVYNEFKDVIAPKFNINKFKSKKSTKKYAFEKEGVPYEATYLEVQYSAQQPQLPVDLSGETFSHVFGCKTSPMENFIISRGLKGPSWLSINKYSNSTPPLSWCSTEIVVGSMSDVRVCTKQQPAPPLVVMTINFTSYYNNANNNNEIMSVSFLVSNKFSLNKKNNNSFQSQMSIISLPKNCVYPFDFKDKLKTKLKDMVVDMVSNERSLLNLFVNRVHKIDPDVLLGHDITSFDLDLLLHRMHVHKVPNWSRVGRLNRKQQIYKSSSNNAKILMTSFAGRLVSDIKTSAMELVRCRSYDLGELCQQILRKNKQADVSVSDPCALFSSSKNLLQLLQTNIINATIVSQICNELNTLPLALQITNICGNLLSRTLVGGRSERNEYLLLHAFNQKDFIVPDKINKKEEGETEKKKADYAGGLVLEPKKGFYDQFVLLLDFNSLYPSIIQEYNICFTTVNIRQQCGDYDSSLLPEQGLPPGVLPTEIRKLVESRRNVRSLMKGLSTSSDLYAQYDIRQKALKLTANSMYGCLGFNMSRFYAKPLASLITGKGREILLKTKDLVEGMNIEVIYGDTDSIMVNTRLVDYNEVISLGNKIKNEVNKLYRLLEIDIDGVYKSLLLLKKKKYAGCMVNRGSDGKMVVKREMKGLDIVRRDWCFLAQEVGRGVLDDIFAGESRESTVERIHNRLIEVAKQANEGSIPTKLFYITKQLAKNPEAYKVRDGLPHVQVAYRLNQSGSRKWKAGDVVYYVICQNGTNDPATKRAYHPDELAKNESLNIDINYYLSQQVHPVISRLVDCIEGTDANHIANCLGIDFKSYRPTTTNAEEETKEIEILPEEKYVECDKFTFKCVSCGAKNEIDAPYCYSDDSHSKMHCSLSKCCNPACTSSPLQHPHFLKNTLLIQIRSYIQKYYEGRMVCVDCSFVSRRVSTLRLDKASCPSCYKGSVSLEYSDKSLYNQLSFFSFIFDLHHPSFKGKALVALKDDDCEVLEDLKKIVDNKLRISAYSHVNLGSLFSILSRSS